MHSTTHKATASTEFPPPAAARTPSRKTVPVAERTETHQSRGGALSPGGSLLGQEISSRAWLTHCLSKIVGRTSTSSSGPGAGRDLCRPPEALALIGLYLRSQHEFIVWKDADGFSCLRVRRKSVVGGCDG